MILRSRSPVRIDFAGGWTDTPPFSEEIGGAVVNASINRYAYVTLRPRATGRGRGSKVGPRAISIRSHDFDLFLEAEDIRKLEYNGSLDLLKAAIRRMGIRRAMDVETRSDAPPGSGLGTSASMGVALIGGLARAIPNPLAAFEIAEMARQIEKEELGIWGGKQDQYAAAIGGINYMEFLDPIVRTSQLDLSRRVVCDLEKHLVLCYTGKSRLSGNIHNRVFGAYRAGNRSTVEALKALVRIARDMKGALLSEDLDACARLMSENWRQQKRLHPSVTNAQIERLFQVARRNGAAGGKACGAGGGGCLLFYSKPEAEHRLRKSLSKAGVRIIDFNFEFKGLEIWEGAEKE